MHANSKFAGLACLIRKKYIVEDNTQKNQAEETSLYYYVRGMVYMHHEHEYVSRVVRAPCESLNMCHVPWVFHINSLNRCHVYTVCCIQNIENSCEQVECVHMLASSFICL